VTGGRKKWVWVEIKNLLCLGPTAGQF